MPRGTRNRWGAISFVLLLTLLVIWAIFDLSAPDSVLAANWNRVFHSQGQGENLRDDVVDRLKSRR